uniref:non-specific serine/threonine protein kinase n=1 Tax=Amphiprion ocellaris TaxID=80972 RepID=A0AAQ5YM84_AMPOC
MESVGKFEFNRKDLIGHGAFAVVFKGRHKEKRDWEVAIKCINKKNFAKSQSLLGKEIKILKELKHENIVRLLDYQVSMYCNGGDLAEYLHSKGTLSEDTIRVFLQQIAQAMKVLQSKGILHRDLKPQNILLCHTEGRRSSSTNTSIKIADFGFARHLQTNTMAATLCGSPMYMAPEVIMSQNYDAKADLWSIGTIVYQCLTGKAPFHASTPQELRLFYESNRTLLPSIPKETSSNLRHLLLGLLHRNHKERISFDEFFHHPFLETSSSTKKCSPAPMLSYPSSGSGSSSSSSSTSQLASPQHSDGEMHRLQPKVQSSPVQDTPGFLLKEAANQDSRNTPSYTEDYVMVPAQFPSKNLEAGSPIESCAQYPINSSPAEIVGRNCSPSVPIPVPTQVQNYQRMEQNLQSVGLNGSTRHVQPCCLCAQAPSIACYYPFSRYFFLLCLMSSRVTLCCAVVQLCFTSGQEILTEYLHTSNTVEEVSELSFPFQQQVQPRMPNRTRTVPNLQSLDIFPASQTNINRTLATKKGPFKRSLSTGKLSDMLLKAAFGTYLFEDGSDYEKSMDITAPPTGCHKVFHCSDSPPPTIFTMGSPSRENTPPDTMLSKTISGSVLTTVNIDLVNRVYIFNHYFRLCYWMFQSHTDALSNLRFTLAFVHCVMELASSKDPGLETISSPDISFLEQSFVADQISLLSREWSYAEQLVLYMKAEEFLSSALHTAKENIKQGHLVTSATVKQVIRKLNELYKNCVTYCRSLNNRLQTFLLDKQKLMDHFNGLTAEKLIYNHTVHMVQSAALDEMFQYGTASVQRYHKALLLMEGLSRNLTEQKDIDSIDKCKQCIERRLSALQT